MILDSKVLVKNNNRLVVQNCSNMLLGAVIWLRRVYVVFSVLIVGLYDYVIGSY
jgi:hypothetical protein